MKKIFAEVLSVVEGRALIAEGFKYIVKCDFITGVERDAWDGMPVIHNNVAAFIDEAEAEAFAKTQVWPFNPNIHAKVEALKWGETDAERIEREAREKAERKAKREAKEAEKAAAAGMTVDEYKAAKAKANAKRKLEKEIAELEKELAAKRAKLARL